MHDSSDRVQARLKRRLKDMRRQTQREERFPQVHHIGQLAVAFRFALDEIETLLDLAGADGAAVVPPDKDNEDDCPLLWGEFAAALAAWHWFVYGALRLLESDFTGDVRRALWTAGAIDDDGDEADDEADAEPPPAPAHLALEPPAAAKAKPYWIP